MLYQASYQLYPSCLRATRPVIRAYEISGSETDISNVPAIGELFTTITHPSRIVFTVGHGNAVTRLCNVTARLCRSSRAERETERIPMRRVSTLYTAVINTRSICREINSGVYSTPGIFCISNAP